jgi:rare lipoprotein A
LASWYSHRFEGRRTASGELYSRYEMTAAHRTLPLGTLLHVTNPGTGVGVVVRINDRGPFSGNRLIDLSFAAANALGLADQGVGQVDIRLPSSDEAVEFAHRLAEAAARPRERMAGPVRHTRAAKKSRKRGRRG